MKICFLKLALLRADVAYQRPHSFTLSHCVALVRTATSLATSLYLCFYKILNGDYSCATI